MTASKPITPISVCLTERSEFRSEVGNYIRDLEDAVNGERRKRIEAQTRLERITMKLFPESLSQTP
jgi:hypothetical protein